MSCNEYCKWTGCGCLCVLEENHIGEHKCSQNHEWSSWFQTTNCTEKCPTCLAESPVENGIVIHNYKDCQYPSPHVYKHKCDKGHEWGWGL
jgi:hypothetical protein